ncbi:hypothetical protein TNIN_235041 [Trichonephila inaurata madagascariensis]|uniref:Uncharacterized protein n=1 Tax=Trichonephila inaurata madagascariensis TaxID=2747483 RepID=A0A8X6JKT2_9ARAC|nr:hypothetical protein TNIN_235041 [Trichonephila inaurata madagascariensis]
MDWIELLLKRDVIKPIPPLEEKEMGKKASESVRKCPLFLSRGAGKRRKERRSGKMDRERKTKPLLLTNFVDIGAAGRATLTTDNPVRVDRAADPSVGYTHRCDWDVLGRSSFAEWISPCLFRACSRLFSMEDFERKWKNKTFV